MLAARSITVFVTGLAMWVAARLLGSPGLEVIAIGIAALPLLAAFAAKRGARHILVRRRLSDVRVTPARADRDARPREPFADRDVVPPARGSLPTPLGRAARLVIGAIRGEPMSRQANLVPQSRGRTSSDARRRLSDPFA